MRLNGLLYPNDYTITFENNNTGGAEFMRSSYKALKGDSNEYTTALMTIVLSSKRYAKNPRWDRLKIDNVYATNSLTPGIRHSLRISYPLMISDEMPQEVVLNCSLGCRAKVTSTIFLTNYADFNYAQKRWVLKFEYRKPINFERFIDQRHSTRLRATSGSAS